MRLLTPRRTPGAAALRASAILVLALLQVGVARAQAPQQQYPLMDMLAQKIIDKYTNSTCVQLATAKSEKPTGEKAVMEQRAVAALKADPRFSDFALVRTSRLSVMPVPAEHWKLICKLGGWR